MMALLHIISTCLSAQVHHLCRSMNETAVIGVCTCYVYLHTYIQDVDISYQLRSCNALYF